MGEERGVYIWDGRGRKEKESKEKVGKRGWNAKWSRVDFDRDILTM